MGLLDYYRQFEDMSQEEVNRRLRERRARERELALQEVPVLDLSGTEWPEFPNSEVMNASIYVARGRINGYPDPHAERLRRSLARRHDVEPERIVVGNGAAELLQAAAFALLGGGGELVTPWPSYPLYPLMAARAGGRAHPVELAPSGGVDLERLASEIEPDTKIVVLCNPNDPTGTYLTADEVAAFAGRLPDHVHLLVDEAYVQFQDAEEEDACLRLTDAFSRVAVFRTFSKAYGLSGLRVGYAVASRDSADLLTRIGPVLGINALSQAAADYALGIADRDIARRRKLVSEQRTRIFDKLGDLPVTAPDSQANFLWLRAHDMSGGELAARLERERILVAPGGPLGDEQHVRIAIRARHDTDRLLAVLERVLRGEREPVEEPGEGMTVEEGVNEPATTVEEDDE